MANDFQNIFYPKSIAIVGASDTPESVGQALCTNLKSYNGIVYFVNPKHAKLSGKTCYPDLKTIGEPVDLALIAVPAENVPTVVEEAGLSGIKNLIIISAGFKETSADGAALEDAIHASCITHGITMIGPNCLGVINPENHLNASFASSIPATGSIAFISQSGALCSSVIDYSKELHLGFSKFVSMGNKTCVDEVALLSYLANDPKTNAIFLYVEDIRNASVFIKTAYNITHGVNAKPIVMLKGGRSDAGAKASQSHTGALGGNDLYYDALAHQSGIIRVHSIADFFNIALVISHNPPPSGGRIAIITNAGGPGILMTDEAVENGLVMTHSPLDLLGDAKAMQYKQALTQIEKDGSVDSTLILLTPQSGTEIRETAQVIIDVPRVKPLAVSFMGKEIVAPGIELLRNAGIAVTEYPEEAARALGQFTRFAVKRTDISEDFSFGGISADQTGQLMNDPMSLLAAYGFPTLQTLVARSAEETEAAVQKIGKPCAIKINSKDILHKTDVGGVLLDITAEKAAAAFDAIVSSVRSKAPSAIITGVSVAEMAPKGREFILGFTRKENFGTVLMVGMGGIYVEIMKDVSFGIVPITKSHAAHMISSLRFSPILTGFRGNPPLDTAVLIDCLGKLSRLAQDMPTIAEFDINPLILYPEGQGAKVVDVRLLPYRPVEQILHPGV